MFWQAFWTEVSIYGPWVVALMGSAIALWPKLTANGWKWLWLFGFLVVGWTTAHGTRISQDALEAKITGGSSVVVVDALQMPWGPQGPPWPLAIRAYGEPIPDATVVVWKMPDGPYNARRAMDAQMHPIVNARLGTVMPVIENLGNVTVGPGVYGVQVYARNGFTYERLEIPKSGPRNESYAVHRPPERVGIVCQPADFYWCDPKPN